MNFLPAEPRHTAIFGAGNNPQMVYEIRQKSEGNRKLILQLEKLINIINFTHPKNGDESK